MGIKRYVFLDQGRTLHEIFCNLDHGSHPIGPNGITVHLGWAGYDNEIIVINSHKKDIGILGYITRAKKEQWFINCVSDNNANFYRLYKDGKYCKTICALISESTEADLLSEGCIDYRYVKSNTTCMVRPILKHKQPDDTSYYDVLPISTGDLVIDVYNPDADRLDDRNLTYNDRPDRCYLAYKTASGYPELGSIISIFLNSSRSFKDIYNDIWMSPFTCKNLEYRADMLTDIMLMGVDYKVWFNTNFPANIASEELVEKRIKEDKQKYAEDPHTIEQKYAADLTTFTNKKTLDEIACVIFDKYSIDDYKRSIIIGFLKHVVPDASYSDVELAVALPKHVYDILKVSDLSGDESRYSAIEEAIKTLDPSLSFADKMKDVNICPALTKVITTPLEGHSTNRGIPLLPARFEVTVRSFLPMYWPNIPDDKFTILLDFLRRNSPREAKDVIYVDESDIMAAIKLVRGDWDAVPLLARMRIIDGGIDDYVEIAHTAMEVLKHMNLNLTISKRLEDDSFIDAIDKYLSDTSPN